MTAAEAAAEFSAEGREGWEVIIPRHIEAREIHRVRSLPRVVGCRYSPTTKGRPPFCTRKSCTRGEYDAARLRERLGAPDASCAGPMNVLAMRWIDSDEEGSVARTTRRGAVG